MSLAYTEKVIEHFKHPRNVGEIENPDGKATEGSSACGDMVAVYLRINNKTEKIENIKFQSYGCASNIATGSIVTELAKGKTISEAKKISWQQAADALGGLPPIKQHCSVLAVDGLRAAIRDYEERNGLLKDRKTSTIAIINERLSHVISPLTGMNVVKSRLIKKIELINKEITIIINISSNHQFANSLKEDIVEKLNALWDIEKVNIKFTE